MLAGSFFIYLYKYLKNIGIILKHKKGYFYKGFSDNGQIKVRRMKIFGPGTQLIVTSKFSLNSSVKVGNAGAAG